MAVVVAVRGGGAGVLGGRVGVGVVLVGGGLGGSKGGVAGPRVGCNGAVTYWVMVGGEDGWHKGGMRIPWLLYPLGNMLGEGMCTAFEAAVSDIGNGHSWVNCSLGRWCTGVSWDCFWENLPFFWRA